MFRGRKIGSARRFGKVVFIVILALLPAVVASAGGPETGFTATGKPESTKPAAETPDFPDSLPKGRRAYQIVLDNTNAFIASKSVGRRIDITAAFPAGPDGLPAALTVLRGTPVIGSRTASGGIALALSVTPADAERLAFAAANARIFISLCSDGPDIAPPTSGVTFDDF